MKEQVTHDGVAEPTGSNRLDSWKEIAAYLRRDESTVRRWEKAGLPVRRHHHKARAAVFAYKSELDAWWANGSATPDPAPQPGESPAPVARRMRRLTWPVVTGALVLVVAAVAIRFATRHPAGATPRILPFTSYSGSVRMPAFSPDGERLAFAWTGSPGEGRDWDIYVRMVGGGPPLQVTSGPGEDSPPAWSPDGRQVAFIRSKDASVTLHVVSALGGPDRKLADLASGRYFNLQWTRDGASLLFAEKTSREEPYDSFRSSAIFRFSIETQQKRQLTFPTDPEADHRFAISPDGATLAFLRHGFRSGVGLFTMPIGGGQPALVHAERAWVGHVAWAADGQSLIFTSMREGGNKLWRVPVSGGEPRPVPITEESAYSPSVALRGDRLAYVREYYDIDLMRVPLTAAGSATVAAPIAASARLETAPALSPDGRRLAFFSEQSGRRELWLANADGSRPIQMTDFYAWSTAPPAWTPDAKRLVFYSAHGPLDSGEGLFALDVETKQVRRLPGADACLMPQVSRDGKWIFAAIGEFDDYRVVRLPIDGGAAVPITGKGALLPRESPDGGSIYYLKTTGGIWRVPAAGGAESLVLRDVAWTSWGNWAVVDRGIYYLKPRTVFSSTLDFYDFATGTSRSILTISGEPLNFEGSVTVSPDGTWAIVPRVARAASDIMLVENFR